MDGIYTLMQSDVEGPANLGKDGQVTAADLVRNVMEVSCRRICVNYVPEAVAL